MANRIIEVRVDDKIASVVGDPLYVCGNSDYVVKFAFDAEWADHAMKTARFIKSNKEYFDVVFNGSECAMPIIDNTPYVRIGVYAGNLCTTTAAIVNAQRSILCGSGVPAEPDPDVYSQIMERIDNLNIPNPDEYSKVIAEQIDALNVPDLTKRVDALQSNAVIAQHVRGDVLHIEDAASWPLEKLVTSIEPMQEGNGDPSPSNIRPISGWAEVTLNVTSKQVIAKFGQTVYGGEFDWETGKLMATWAKVVAADIGWYAYGAYEFGAQFITQHFDYFPDNAGAVAKVKANFCPAVFIHDAAPYQGKTFLLFSSGTSQTSLMVAQEDVGAGVELTLNNVKNWLNSIGAYIVYELKTPTEIQLTPQQMPELLKGVNDVWCDTGETELVYIADNQLYIDQKIGASTAALNALMEGINNA